MGAFSYPTRPNGDSHQKLTRAVQGLFRGRSFWRSVSMCRAFLDVRLSTTKYREILDLYYLYDKSLLLYGSGIFCKSLEDNDFSSRHAL